MISARIGANDVVSHNNPTECDVSKVSTVAVKLAHCEVRHCSLARGPLGLHERLPDEDARVHDAALEPLCAGLVAGVGGADVLPDLLDDCEQLRVLAGVEARPQLARPRPAPRPVRGGGPALALGQRGARGHGLAVEAADVVIHLLQIYRHCKHCEHSDTAVPTLLACHSCCCCLSLCSCLNMSRSLLRIQSMYYLPLSHCLTYCC